MHQCSHFLLWGSAGHAKVLADIIWLRGGEILALFDNNPCTVSCLPGTPLYHGVAGLHTWLKTQKSLKKIGAVIAIGGFRGEERYNLAQQLKDIGFPFPTIIHPTSVISNSATIGEGCHIFAHSVISADVSIGNLCIINNSANIDHESRLGKCVHIAPGAILCGCVSVKDNTMIGAGAVVLPRLNIGSNVLVGAGAVVTRDVPNGVTVTGNPAKIIGNKND